MLELDPHYPVAHLNLGLVHAAQGKYPEAIAAFERALSLDPGSAELTALLGYALARSGKRAQATALLAELQAKSSREFVQPFAIGLVHLGLGDHDAAVDSLERGYLERSWMTVLIKVNPELDALRGNSRFEALVRRLSFPE
jgi:Flp pilus assembly protein TadD